MADYTKLFGVHADLNYNQLLRAVLERQLTVAPATPVEGQMYWNDADKTAYVYNGTVWLDMANLVTSLSGLTDTTITSVAAGEIISWDGSDWINQTLAEAGISAVGHNHSLDSLSNVTITANSNGELLVWNGSAWINQTLAELNIAAADAFASHTGDTTIHFVINDGGVSTSEAWSASKIDAEITAINDIISGALVYKGGYNATTNTPALDATSGATITGITVGWTYTVTADGTFFSEEVQTGDMLIAEVDDPTTAPDWTIVNKNIPDIVPASETEAGIIELATQGETNTGSDDFRAVTPLKLEVKLGTYRYSANIGNGALTSIPVSHGLATVDVINKVSRVSDGKVIICDDIITSSGVLTLNFNVAPTSNEYRVTIQK
jgi:hypothetical protein